MPLFASQRMRSRALKCSCLCVNFSNIRVVEAGAGVRAVDQPDGVRRRRVEAGDGTSRKSKCYRLLAFVLIIISFLSLIFNICITFYRNHRVDGAIGSFVSVVSFYASLSLFTYLNSRTGRGAVRSRGDRILRRLGQTETTGITGSRSGQVPAIDVGNPSASLPAHLPDPAVAGPSGLQSPVQPVSGEHTYRTLRSGEKTFGSESRHSEWPSVQASVSGESPATRKISDVAFTLSQTAAEGLIRRKGTLPTRKESFHEESTSDDSISD